MRSGDGQRERSRNEEEEEEGGEFFLIVIIKAITANK